MVGAFVVLTGAAGSGKTTIAQTIEASHPEYTVFHFDSIGVPSEEIMDSFGPGYQPGGAWQRAMTLQWLGRLAPTLTAGSSVLLEGQIRIAFIEEALKVARITNGRIILVECDEQTRSARLIINRKQPELVNERTIGWGAFLHREAAKGGHEILDTSTMPLEDAVSRVANYLAV